MGSERRVTSLLSNKCSRAEHPGSVALVAAVYWVGVPGKVRFWRRPRVDKIFCDDANRALLAGRSNYGSGSISS